MRLWFCISEDSREKLKGLAPSDWLPPVYRENPGKRPIKLEDTEEIDKIMREKPHSPRRNVK